LPGKVYIGAEAIKKFCKKKLKLRKFGSMVFFPKNRVGVPKNKGGLGSKPDPPKNF